MFKLVISDDEGKTTVVPLVREEITLGRSEGNTIRLTERNVSRRHAVLRKTESGYRVEDLDSYNGTFVNGRRIEGPTDLTSGDELRIGDYQLALHADSGEVGDTPSAPAAQAEPSIPPARLVMLTAPVPGAEFALKGDHLRLGRSEDLDIWINHRSISREHAEIFRDEDGTLRIADLGSANGIRLNGEEVEEAVLEPYDVIKLGRVRLRYIPEGEGYVFDPEAEAPDDDDADDADASSSRAPLFMALGIVAVALVVGGVIIAYAGMPAAEADGAEAEAAEDGVEGTVDAPPEDAPAPTAEERVAACEDALKDGHFEEAAEQAEAALGVRPDDDAAAECRQKARAGVAFHRGYRALRDGDPVAAYEAFQKIPEGNPFREHPSMAEAGEQYAAHHVAQAEALAEEDPDQALEHVRAVLAMPSPPKAHEASAKRLRRTLRRPRASGGKAGGKPGGSGEGSGGAAAFDRALECARQGDNECVVQALEGKATTARGLALLIETYRAMGRSEEAATNMRRFVQRFPDDRRASRYRQLLDNQP
ncbi:MAG: FHA domain-containing protein [Myxococcota bacterium]